MMQIIYGGKNVNQEISTQPRGQKLQIEGKTIIFIKNVIYY